jgi:hypothetical protein
MARCRTKEQKKNTSDKMDYKALAAKGILQSRALLNERFSQLNYGEEKVTMYEPVNDEDVECLYEELKRIDSHFNWRQKKLT